MNLQGLVLSSLPNSSNCRYSPQRNLDLGPAAIGAKPPSVEVGLRAFLEMAFLDIAALLWYKERTS
jgi:hypothetical protein